MFNNWKSAVVKPQKQVGMPRDRCCTPGYFLNSYFNLLDFMLAGSLESWQFILFTLVSIITR